MLLTIKTTHQPATDLGWLMHKHPDKVQSFELSSYGKAHVFYPEASEESTAISLLVDINPITLSRGTNRGGKEGFTLQQYVNDRPYVASSFMSKALSKVFSSAMNGNCKDRPELVDIAMPLEANISVLPAKGGLSFIETLFEPLGYEIKAEHIPLDEKFPEWGESRYFKVQLKNTIPVKDLLSHLYVLIPVLDGEKHYWVSPQEMEKLLDKGGEWLAKHPAKEMITRRYLKYLNAYANEALERLIPEEDKHEQKDEDEEKLEAVLSKKKGMGLNDLRHQAVLDQVIQSGAKSVVDLGCSSGKFSRRLFQETQFDKIIALDVSHRMLKIAKDRIYHHKLPEEQKERIQFLQGSLIYRDQRIEHMDAAVLIEVIEHIEPSRHPALLKVLFQFSQTKTIIITTPNIEYNVLFENMTSPLRHSDHRFEWTRAEFKTWVESVCALYPYEYKIHPIGPIDEQHGAPTQMAVFTLKTS